MWLLCLVFVGTAAQIEIHGGLQLLVSIFSILPADAASADALEKEDEAEFATPATNRPSSLDKLFPGAGSSCDARYATPCARANSQRLAEAVALSINDAKDDPDELERVLESITSKEMNRDSGFYPFVFRRDTGKCVAHGADEDLVNRTAREIFDDSHQDPNALHERFISTHESWVSYLLADGGIKTAYIVNNITDASGENSYFVGVGYEGEPLPLDLPCSDRFDRWCSLTAVRNLVGRAQFALEQADSLPEFESIKDRISFDTNQYKVPGGFYLFMYSFDGDLEAHGILRDDSFDKNLSEIFVHKHLGSHPMGEGLHETFRDSVSGDHPVAWVQYPWRDSPHGDTYTKVALLARVEFGEESFYVGAGFRFSGMASDSVDQALDPPLGEICSAQYNLPCSFRTAYQLSSHSLVYALSSSMPKDEVFQSLSRGPSFKSGNFYLFVYSFDTHRCVAHGGDESLVNKTLVEIFEELEIPLDGNELHEQFKSAAKNGGGWVKYDWVNLDNFEPFQKISYIFQITIDGEDYYGGIGFNHLRYPVEEFANVGLKQNGNPIPCSSQFLLACSEINARAILGQALAEIVLCTSEVSVVEDFGSTETALEEVLNDISKQDPNFSVGSRQDPNSSFSVSVFSFGSNPACVTNDGSGCAVAYGPNSEYVGLTWNEIIERDNAVTIQGTSLHQKLIDASNSDTGVLMYPYQGTKKRALVAQFKHAGENYYVVADYLTAKMGPTCLTLNRTNGCPRDMECTEEGEICQSTQWGGVDKTTLGATAAGATTAGATQTGAERVEAATAGAAANGSSAAADVITGATVIGICVAIVVVLGLILLLLLLILFWKRKAIMMKLQNTQPTNSNGDAEDPPANEVDLAPAVKQAPAEILRRDSIDPPAEQPNASAVSLVDLETLQTKSPHSSSTRDTSLSLSITNKKRDKKNQTVEVSSSVEPHDNDVIFDRQGSMLTHPGNIKFCQKASKFRRWYKESTTSKEEKQTIKDLIVESVTCDGNRFLEKRDDGLWHEIVGKEGRRNKASQALRSKLLY